MKPKRKKAPAGLTAADKDMQAILDKPYKEWTGRDLGRMAIYDSILSVKQTGYSRLFNPEKAIDIADIFLLLSKNEQQTVLDYYAVYEWLVAARKTANRAETEREFYISKVISFIDRMSAADQIINSYKGDVPDRVKEKYGQFLPVPIFDFESYIAGNDDRTTKERRNYIEHILAAKGVIYSNLACIIAYNRVIDRLADYYGIPNLDEMKLALYDRPTRTLSDHTFYRPAYNYLRDLIADRISEKDMDFFTVLLKPEYVLQYPTLLDTWETSVSRWIDQKGFSDNSDTFIITDALDSTLKAAEKTIYLPPEYQDAVPEFKNAVKD